MKVNGVGGPTAAPTSRTTARTGAGFSLPGSSGASATPAAAATASTGNVAGVSALMALQGVEDPTERRRRAIRRGSSLLDRLDELKLTLLGGGGDSAAILDRLSRNLAEERDKDDDQGLNSLLDQIDVRAAVELAKAEMARNRR